MADNELSIIVYTIAHSEPFDNLDQIRTNSVEFFSEFVLEDITNVEHYYHPFFVFCNVTSVEATYREQSPSKKNLEDSTLRLLKLQSYAVSYLMVISIRGLVE